MIKKLAVLALILTINSQLEINASDNRLEEAPEAPLKEVAINLSCKHRKDIIVDLAIGYNPHLDNINFVLGFPQLRNLNLMGSDNLKDNYHPVSQLTNLRKLCLYNIDLTRTDYLRPLTGLISLRISFPNMKSAMKDITHLTKLRELGIACYGDNNIMKVVKIGRITSLKKLTLAGLFNNDDDKPNFCYPPIDFISSLSRLRTLNLLGNDLIYSVSPIAELKSLTELNLNGCHSLRDLHTLRRCTSLKKLDLGSIGPRDVPTIEKDLKFIRKIKSLIILSIDLRIKCPKFPANVTIHKD